MPGIALASRSGEAAIPRRMLDLGPVAATVTACVILTLLVLVPLRTGFGSEPGTVFRDCDECPEMVVAPPGSFRMGDLSGGGDVDEGPVRKVTIRARSPSRNTRPRSPSGMPASRPAPAAAG